MLLGDMVRLRALEREDIPTFVAWFNDPEVREHLLLYTPMSRAQEERWCERMLERENDFLFGIEAQDAEDADLLPSSPERLTGGLWALVGNIGLHGVDWKNRGATLGIVLGQRDCWGRGIGVEAIRIMLRFAFHELGLHRVQLEVFVPNRRAQRAYHKVGFRREGIRRQAFFQDGRYVDCLMLAMLREEYEARYPTRLDLPDLQDLDGLAPTTKKA